MNASAKPFLCLVLILWVSLPVNSMYESFVNGHRIGSDTQIVIDDERYSPAMLQLPWTINHKKCSDLHVFNILARSLGIPGLTQPGETPSIPVNLLTQPRGNMFFSIEGGSQAIPSESKILGRTKLVEITRTSRPYTPFATLATALTGQQPKDHGVTTMKNNTTPLSNNFFDLARQVYPESVIIGGSLSQTAARLFSPRHASSSYHLDHKTGSWMLGKDVALSKDTFFSFLEKLRMAKNEFEDVEKTRVVVDHVVFDLNDKADLALLAEIAFVVNATNYLKTVDTKAPNFFSFNFESLRMIGCSTKYTAAMKLIDAVIDYAVNDQWVYEVMFLPHQANDKVKAVKNIINPILQPYTKSLKTFPHFQLRRLGHVFKVEVCGTLRKALEEVDGVNVFCTMTHRQYRKRAVLEDYILHDSEEKKNNTVSQSDVFTLHVILWPSIIVAIAALWGIYALAFMPPDFALYAATSYMKPGYDKNK